MYSAVPGASQLSQSAPIPGGDRQSGLGGPLPGTLAQADCPSETSQNPIWRPCPCGRPGSWDTWDTWDTAAKAGQVRLDVDNVQRWPRFIWPLPYCRLTQTRAQGGTSQASRPDSPPILQSLLPAMSKHYIWCRAWPLFLGPFPFEAVEVLEGDVLMGALNSLALDWSGENPGAVDKARAANESSRRSKANGVAKVSINDPPRYRPRDPNRPLEFSEVAEIAGWVSPPRGLVTVHEKYGIYYPSAVINIHVTEDGAVAAGIVEALRSQRPRLGTGHGPRGAASSMRYGVLDSSSLDRTQRVVMARSFEELSPRMAEDDGWIGDLSKEAAALERLVVDEAGVPDVTPPAPPKKTKPRTAEGLTEPIQRALASYEWVIANTPELASDSRGHMNAAHAALKAAVELERCPIYEGLRAIPSPETWKRYVRKGTGQSGEPRQSSRTGRTHGSSIVRQGEVEPRADS